MSKDPGAALERARAFERESVALVADEVVAIPEGWVARARSLPDVWVLNYVGVRRALTFPEALELVERHLAELPYRQLEVEHQESGARLEGELRAAGWRVERNVTMVLGEPNLESDTNAVVEVAEEEALELMERWLDETDGDHHPTPDELGQLVEATRLTWRARRTRRLGVRGANGGLAGITMLFSDGRTAQVEDVYVVEAERGRGLGRALVARAAELARELGHELTFIAADDRDWPKELYAQVGFQPVGFTWVCHWDAPGRD